MVRKWCSQEIRKEVGRLHHVCYNTREEFGGLGLGEKREEKVWGKSYFQADSNMLKD